MTRYLPDQIPTWASVDTDIPAWLLNMTEPQLKMPSNNQLFHTRSLSVGGETVQFMLRRSRRSRRLSLCVNDNAEVIVRLPLRTSLQESERFIEANTAWLIKHLRAAHTKLRTRLSLIDGAFVPLLDEQLRLRLHCGRNMVKRVAEELHVYSPSHEHPVLSGLLEQWYRKEAKIHMAQRLIALSAQIGVQAKSLTIRGQKTCWGSCSARGAISINWRLILAPSHVVDYVLVHELCHLRHLNHSPEFWDSVEKIEPDYRGMRKLLRQLQPRLVL